MALAGTIPEARSAQNECFDVAENRVIPCYIPRRG